MPRINLSQRNKLAAAGAALALVIGIGAKVLRTDDYSRETTAALRDAGLDRVTGARGTDLLTGPVEPGAEVTTGVNLPLGARVTEVIPLGPFTLVGEVRHTDNSDATWAEVTAKNTSKTAIRFVGFVAFDVPIEEPNP